METKPINPQEIKTKNLINKFLFFGKIGGIGFLLLLLLWPMQMVQSLIKERENRESDVQFEVFQSWGQAQTIGAPMLTVPFKVNFKTKVEEDGKTVEKIQTRTEYAHFLPNHLKINSTLDPEIRYRGIFKVPLYQSKLQISGEFDKPNFEAWQVEPQDILWDQAIVAVGISDTRAIKESVDLEWNGKTFPFAPGAGFIGVYPAGIHVPGKTLALGSKVEAFDFKIDLKLAGSEKLRFLPLGGETDVKMRSSWPHPKFSGSYLPVEREISDNGFSAVWKILELGRNHPQSWLAQTVTMENLEESAFGVDILFPVDSYLSTTRSVKYAMLFILLTFGTFFLFEVFSQHKVHPVQYLLVGFALCLFYLLLLSLSEQISFAKAYLISTISTVGLISAYCMRILKNKWRTIGMVGLLTGLYAYLYTLLQVEDFSLIMGSIGLFLILAVVMYVTRKLNWYEIAKR